MDQLPQELQFVLEHEPHDDDGEEPEPDRAVLIPQTEGRLATSVLLHCGHSTWVDDPNRSFSNFASQV